MSLRRSFVVYLCVLHLLIGALAVLLVRQGRWWVLGAEVVFVASLLWGLALVRKTFATLSLLRSGAQLLRDTDFQTRFRETGRPETDELVRVYNRMADHLREERVRLQEQQFLLAKILDASPSGVALLDFDGRITYANPRVEHLLRAAGVPLRGRSLGELDSPLARALDRMEPGQTRVVPLWGGRRVRCHRGSFIDRGFSRGFVLLEELTDELRQQEKGAYEKLVRMLSHEVNNTVGAASSLLHSCLAYARHLPEADRADFEAALRVAAGRTAQLGAFMRGFADVVRLPAPRPQPCDLHELLGGIAVLMGPACEERRVEWRWAVEAPLEPVAMDRAQMEQVFVNVCKNALEAIGRDGVITIRLGRRHGRPFVAVEDTGAGVPEDVRPHLFTPFFSTKDQGQGVGLTMVQEVLAQHRFEYSLDGSPGGPTRFTILF